MLQEIDRQHEDSHISSEGESIDLALKQKTNQRTAQSNPLETNTRTLWEPLPEQDEELFLGGTEAVMHQAGAKGRRSAIFPQLNITATAKKLGVTKSHLAKVLAGVNRPSIELAIRLAETLGTDINVVVNLYKSRPPQPPAPIHKRSHKKVKKHA